MSRRSENHEAIEFFFSQLCSNFGYASGEAIKRIMIETLGGMRITVPTLKNLCREERDQRIRNLFNGANHQELAIMFDLAVGQIRKIVNKK